MKKEGEEEGFDLADVAKRGSLNLGPKKKNWSGFEGGWRKKEKGEPDKRCLAQGKKKK